MSIQEEIEEDRDDRGRERETEIAVDGEAGMNVLPSGLTCPDN